MVVHIVFLTWKDGRTVKTCQKIFQNQDCVKAYWEGELGRPTLSIKLLLSPLRTGFVYHGQMRCHLQKPKNHSHMEWSIGLLP